MNTRRRTFLLAALAVTGVAVSLFFVPGGAPLPEGAAAAAARDRSCGRGAGAGLGESRPDARALGWYGAPVGRVLSFDYRLRSEFSLSGDRDEGLVGDQSGHLEHRCRLSLSVVERSAGELVVVARFADVQIATAGGIAAGSGRDIAAHRAALAHPVAVRMSTEGRILGYGFTAATSGEGRNTVRGLLAAFQFTVPDDGTATWTRTDADAAGRYEARYTRQGRTVHRRKLRYVEFGAALGIGGKHTIAGAARAEFDPAVGWLRSAHVDETLALDLEILPMHTAVRIAGRMDLAAMRDDPRVALAPQDVAWHPASGVGEDLGEAAEADERDRWRAQLAGVGVDELVDSLRALLAQHGIASREVYEEWQKLSWLLRLRPEAIDGALASVVGGRVTGDLAGLLLSALGAAGTEPAQAALVTVFADAAVGAALRSAACESLVQVERPMAAVFAALDQRLGRGSREALDATTLLVLGALAPRAEGAAGGPLRRLLAFESDAQTRGQTKDWLTALGNAGTPAILPAVERHRRGGNDDIRATAVAALRRVGSPRAIAILLKHAGAGPSVDVRAAAIGALGPRRARPRVRSALQRLVQAAGPVRVRRAALAALVGPDAPVGATRQFVAGLARRPDAVALHALARGMLQRAN